MHKVLISDSMSKVAQTVFEKNKISVDINTGLSEEEIIKIIPDYDYKHADFLTKKYLGRERYPFKRPDEKRIILKIKPEKIFVLPHLPMSDD